MEPWLSSSVMMPASCDDANGRSTCSGTHSRPGTPPHLQCGHHPRHTIVGRQRVRLGRVGCDGWVGYQDLQLLKRLRTSSVGAHGLILHSCVAMRVEGGAQWGSRGHSRASCRPPGCPARYRWRFPARRRRIESSVPPAGAGIVPTPPTRLPGCIQRVHAWWWWWGWWGRCRTRGTLRTHGAHSQMWLRDEVVHASHAVLREQRRRLLVAQTPHPLQVADGDAAWVGVLRSTRRKGKISISMRRW